jgi:hypothetical protein
MRLASGSVALAMVAAVSATAPSVHAARRHTLTVARGSMTLAFTSSAWSRLSGSAGGTAGSDTSAVPIAPATESASTFTFPISGGSLSTASGRGTVTASGGISVASSGTNSFFTSSASASASNPVAVLGVRSRLTVTSESFSPPTVVLLRLGNGVVKSSSRRRAMTISDIPATVTTASQQLFGIAGSFSVGEQIGTVTIRASGRFAAR